MTSENSPLILNDHEKNGEAAPPISKVFGNIFAILKDHEKNGDGAPPMSKLLGNILVTLQVVVFVILFLFFRYDDVEAFSTPKYIIFRDIMVMLLLGFGYLMTFLRKYGLGAVGFTMMITVLNMECNLLFEGILSNTFTISIDSFIDAEFSAAALLISYGALIGRATPLQMCIISIIEALFYAINKVIIVFGLLKAEDVGGTITIHMFGALFGLAASKALGPQEKDSASNNSTSRVSDIFSFIGTTLLWVYWPSFVGATESDSVDNEMHCVMNTILALMGSTGAAFYLSQYLNHGKFDPVHIQNSTLAGGVAIGATARLPMAPGVALLIGILAGLVSVAGYFFSSPYLEKAFGLYDTCGVGNLHGYPSLLGGILSIVLVSFYSDVDFLEHGLIMQIIVQTLAVVGTIVVALASGYYTGLRVFNYDPEGLLDKISDYEDAVWWEGEFDSE